MSGYKLSPAARADLDRIWEYTVERWSLAQAERYIGDIDDACRQLAAGQRISQVVDVRDGYRKSRVGSHVLYFKVGKRAEMVVMRILHTSMDVRRHL